MLHMDRKLPPQLETLSALLRRVDARLLVEVGVVVLLPLLAVLLFGATLWAGIVAGVVAVLYVLFRAHQRGLYERSVAQIDTLRAQSSQLEQLDQAKYDMITALDRAAAGETVVRIACETLHANAAVLYINSISSSRLSLLQKHQRAGFPINAPDTLTFTPSSYTDDVRSLAEESGSATLVEALLRANGSIVGLLRLYYNPSYSPSPAETTQIRDFVRYSAVVLDNLELLNVMESYANDMAQLAHLSRISGSSLSFNDILTNMTSILKQMVNARRVTLAIVRSDSSTPLLDLYSDVSQIDTLSFDNVPELATLRQQERPRPAQYRLDGSFVSPGMSDLIQMHGTTLTVFPLISYVNLLGLILIGDAEMNGVSDARFQLLEMASNQVASQVLNSRVHALTHQALDQRLEQLNILATVAQQISAALDPDTILATMLEMAVKSTNSNVGTVALLQEGEETWKIIQYSDSGVLQRSQRTRQGDDSLIGQVARTRESLLIRDTREIPNVFATSTPNLYLSSAAVPLVSEDKLIGVLNMESLRADFYSKEQIGFLNNLARHAVISIENARLLEERQHQVMSLRHLQGLSMRLSSVTETSYVALEVVRTALDLLHGRKGVLYRIVPDDDQRRMELLAEVNEEGEGTKPSHLFKNSTVVARAAQTGEIQILQEVRQINDGAQERFYAIAVPIKRGDRVREILCIGFDRQRSFSKRELDSIALLATQAAGHLENANLHEYIRARSDRTRAILNSTRDGIILLDKQGRLADTNPAARRLLGIESLDERLNENFVEMLLQFANSESVEQAGYTREDVTALARQLRLEPQLISRRQFTRKTPGQTLYIEEIGSPVTDFEGQVVGRLLVLRDITKQKQLEEYREEITHMAVHDLRGPLGSIISSIHFAISEPELSDESSVLRKTLGLSLDSASNLMRLIESLLDINKLEKREMPLNRELIPASDLITGAVTTLNSTINEAQITIEQNLPEMLPRLNVDPDIVRRVLVNLLDNALRFSPKGSKIVIEALECPDTVMLRIADSGPGIPEGERDHVFERFRQVKGNVVVRGSRGSGLGLTFCKLAVEAHGGRIWVERDSPLSGACMAILLPAEPAKA
jgi:two-component system, NtrC family, sensor histidine kinase KinB